VFILPIYFYLPKNPVYFVDLSALSVVGDNEYGTDGCCIMADKLITYYKLMTINKI
jgi:hypothetical protein